MKAISTKTRFANTKVRAVSVVTVSSVMTVGQILLALIHICFFLKVSPILLHKRLLLNIFLDTFQNAENVHIFNARYAIQRKSFISHLLEQILVNR